jgi:hypothetical protein
MRTLLAIGCLGFLSLGLIFPSSSAFAADQPSGAASKPSLPDGVTMKDLKEQDDIRGGLATLVNHAIQTKNLDDFVERFVKSDENRLKEFSEKDHPDLDKVITSFRDQFKAKYGSDFDMNGERALPEQHASIIQGEISNPAMLSDWPLSPAEGKDIPKEKSGDENSQKLDQGRNVAVVQLNAEGNLPALTASVIHQLPDSWVLDIPDNLTGEKLEANLREHITYLSENQKSWPADGNDACRLVAHHVLMACYDISPTQPDAKAPVFPK